MHPLDLKTNHQQVLTDCLWTFELVQLAVVISSPPLTRLNCQQPHAASEIAAVIQHVYSHSQEQKPQFRSRRTQSGTYCGPSKFVDAVCMLLLLPSDRIEHYLRMLRERRM